MKKTIKHTVPGKKSGPGWFQEVQTYTAWPQMPNAHGPFGKDKLTPKERKALQGVPLFLNVQTAKAIREAHQLGARALSYLSFMDTYVHTAGFENGTARVPWDPKKPQILLLNKDGAFVNTHMDGTHRMWRYYVCNNTRVYVEMALQMVHAQMRNGADGIFVDNSCLRLPCYGHGIPVGYSQKYRSVVTAIPEWKHRRLVESKLPEELFRMGERPLCHIADPTVNTLKHRHIYPGKSHIYAYEKLLEKVRKIVRSYGSDKIVVVNGKWIGDPRADGSMLESFMYSWISKGCLQDWNQVKAATRGSAYLKNGGRFAALSYFGNTDRSVAEDAFYSFAAAVLLGFLWSDAGTFKSPLGKKLRALRLGKRLTPLGAAGSIEYSFFGKGLVAINGSSRTQAANVSACREFAHARLQSLFDEKKTALKGGTYHLSLPAHSGRVYLIA